MKTSVQDFAAKECVDLILTDIAVTEVTKERLIQVELAPDWTLEDVQTLSGLTPRMLMSILTVNNHF